MGALEMRYLIDGACSELFANAALELENLDSLLLVLSGAARGLFGVNMGAITADWPEHGKQSAGFTKSTASYYPLKRFKRAP